MDGSEILTVWWPQVKILLVILLVMCYFEMQTFFLLSTMFLGFILVLLYAHYLRDSCPFTEAASTAGMVWQKVVVVLKPFQTALYLENNSQPLTTREGRKFKNFSGVIFFFFLFYWGIKHYFCSNNKFCNINCSITWNTLNSQSPFSK